MFEDEPKFELPKARPVIGWPGGKGRLLKHILPHVPDHLVYVEVFGGGLAVFLGKPPSDVEVINDINGDLVSFYRCCKYHLDPLLDELDLVTNSRQEMEDFLRQPGLTEIQRAARWFIRNKISFGGMGETFAVSRVRPLGSRVNRLTAIRSLNRRLDRTTIENVSWEKCLDLYDHPKGFFFLDPPYLDSGGGAYKGWSELELERFAIAVHGLQAKWMVTFQDCEQVRTAFGGKRIIPIERANGIGNNHGKTGRTYREVMILSEDAPRGRRRKGGSAS
ncbi:DNA adenine methylase [Actomonas aquatica]|uniref:site-specific DNA-methyltransferase (adenine-specific) n=1 Tax=Actomonas aquatica TaxID=2866162 RepID=A0ABZ1CDF7_9BACT|nr:DNA adenine methylase [Opitutus sp. WL0086]WRQ89405.1 DNA adenine methylase [Opitutus sp. WL0086]